MTELTINKDGLASNERLVDGVLEYRFGDGQWQEYTLAALSDLLIFERKMYAAASSS